MLTATVRKVGRGWVVEHSYPRFNEPIQNTVTWKVTGARREAPYGFAPELADGLTVTAQYGDSPFQAYGRGGYLILSIDKDGSAIDAPIPCPKVRKGTETRYRNGQWEKLLKTGWVAA
jgi:hypothetical protein